jgi:hypothetical protein
MLFFAFEVMEHIEDPLRVVRDLFKRYSCRPYIFYGDVWADGTRQRLVVLWIRKRLAYHFLPAADAGFTG